MILNIYNTESKVPVIHNGLVEPGRFNSLKNVLKITQRDGNIMTLINNKNVHTKILF